MRQQELHYKNRLCNLGKNIESTTEAIKSAVYDVDGSLAISSVYECGLAFLTGEGCALSEIWNRCWNFPEFEAYTIPRWSLPLVKELKGPDFLLLGIGEAVPEILEFCAPRMKTLRWVLTSSDFDQEVQDYADFFCEEYGLAIRTDVRQEERTTLRLSEEGAPVCVLDFAGKAAICGGALPGGSIWVDFCSLEEKEQRLGRISPGTSYVSMKKYWRECKRKNGISAMTGVKERCNDCAGTVPRFHNSSVSV